MIIKILEQMFYKNHFLTSFRLQISFNYLWVDVKVHVGSVLLGKWLFPCLYLMYEIHKRNSIGCGLLNRRAKFYGLCTCDGHRLEVDKEKIVSFLIWASYGIFA